MLAVPWIGGDDVGVVAVRFLHTITSATPARYRQTTRQPAEIDRAIARG